MKNKIRSLIMVTLLTLISMAAWSQAVGDYGSVAASAYSDVATWKKWDGTGFNTAATVVPTASDNVWIRGGFTVTISSSPARCKNLVIASDGTLIGSTTNPSSSQVYIRVSGDSIRNDGYFGVTAAAPTTYTAIGIEPYIPGGTLRLSGDGTTKLSRIRNGSGIHFTTVVIDQDVFLSYNGSTGNGGSAWYGDNGSGVGSTLKINAGKKLTVTDGGAIATNSSVDTDGPRTTIQVDGTLSLPGANSTMSLRPAKDTGTVTLIVNGIVEVGRTFKPTGTAGTGSNRSVITVNAGGILKLGTAGVGITYFHNPLQTVTGDGAVQFVGGTLQIGAPAGLDPVNGPIRTATRTFSATGGYTFLGKNQSTGSDFPAVVGDITIADTGTVTLTNNITVNGNLSLNLGSLVANGKTMAFGSAGSVAYNDTTTATTTTDLEFPAVNGPKKVTLNNFKGLTLHASRTIDSLVLTNGIVSLGENTLTVNYTAVGGGAGKYVAGKLPYTISAAGTKKWETGQGTDYLPFTAAMSSVTGSDVITVMVNDKNTVAPAGTYTADQKVLRRYFRVAKGAGITAFTADSLVLSYTNADAVEQGVTDENGLRVFKHDGTTLSPVTVSRRDTVANSITVTGVTSFSDFVLMAPEVVVMGNVTFQVNMKVQSRIKKFDPAKDTVIVRGDFYQGTGNWWDANDLKLTDGDGDSIYVGTFNVGPVPKRLGKYKFVKRGPSFVGDVWEINMGPNNDRTDTVPSTPWTLPVVWFDYDSTSNQILVPPVLPLDFEATNVDYTFTNFSGATTTRIANPQSSGINTSGFVAKTVKGVGDPWAGSFITLEKPIDFSAGMVFKVKVFMPRVGAKLLFKVENLTNGAINKEIDVAGTVANAWEELTYDFSTLDTTKTYQKVVLIFDLGTSGDGSANFTYLVDDIRLVKAAPALPLTFESNGVDFNFTNFDGATTTRIANPNSGGINTSGFVAKTIKGAGQPWAGSYLTLQAPVDLSKGKIFKAKVFMPKVGAKMLFKLENLTNGTINKEVDAVATKANEWEELTWDFSTIDATKEYQKVVVIFDLGTTGDGGANFTYFFDDIQQTGPPANVTFQVNMKVQAKLKKFDPAKDTVVLRGDFYQGAGNWWDANDQKLTDLDGDSIYVGSFGVGAAPKRLSKFKYVVRGPVGGDRWEVDMGANKDRTDTIPSLPWTLPVVWFNNDSTSQYSDNFITFQVNMKKQMKFAKFDKAKDTVVVRGDFNGWAGYTHVLTDPNVDSIFTGTFNIQSVKKIIYKFVMRTSSGDQWEANNDRIDSLLNGTPRTEPVVWFGNDSILTSIRRDELAAVTQYELLQNYPNPFNPSTTIAFSILKDGWTSLKIFNVVGQEVATIVNQHLTVGKHIATFNASNLTSGVYFYTLETGSFKSIKKMLLLK